MISFKRNDRPNRWAVLALLGDLFGRKWTFSATLLGFSVASVLGGLAHSVTVLVGARALQGSVRGAYLSVMVAAAGMFSLLLFLTFYMQRDLEFSPLGATSNAAAVHGYTAACSWGVGAFALGLVTVLLILPGRTRPSPRPTGPAISEAAARTSAAVHPIAN